jgi:hypothetical protein
MNKVVKILLALIGGLESVFSMVSPILLVTLWINFYPSNRDFLFLTLGLTASIFRAIKIGWLKE